MSMGTIRIFPFRCSCSSALARYRFVDITDSTQACAYSSAGSKPDGVTVVKNATAVGSAYQISVRPLSHLDSTFFITLAGSVSRGDKLFATTDGEAVGCAHSDVIDHGRQSDTPSAPTEGDKYIVPSAGWASDPDHENAVAVRGSSAWAFTDVAADTNVGLTVFVASEGRYKQWNGTSWVAVVPAAIANQAGVDGQFIEAYNNGVESARSNPVKIKTLGSYTTAATGTTIAISDPNLEANDQVFVNISAQSGTVYVVKAVPSAGSLTITTSAAYATGMRVDYVALEPFSTSD